MSNHRTIRRGQIWTHINNDGSKEEYILTQINDTMFALISLNSGNRFTNSLECSCSSVQNLHDEYPGPKISYDDFKKLWGSYGNFEFSCEPPKFNKHNNE